LSREINNKNSVIPGGNRSGRIGKAVAK